MYLLRCKYLHLFKKNCTWSSEGDTISITVKIRYPHDVNIILFQNIQKYIQFSDLEKDGETLFYSLLQ